MRISRGDIWRYWDGPEAFWGAFGFWGFGTALKRAFWGAFGFWWLGRP